jgi:type IV pilus assembly protein PilB
LGKYNIDDILQELGVEGPKPGQAPSPATPKHRVDQAEAPLAPVPAQPANQGRELARGGVPALGEALAGGADARGDIGAMLVSRGAITPERLAIAQQIVRASPGKRLTEALVEQGADEIAVQAAAAELARIPFERIDFDKGTDAFDGRMLQRLTVAFCKQHQAIPLRTVGNSIVVGTTQPENVFLLDEIRRATGVQSVKLVAIPTVDVKGALETLGEKSGDTVDVNEILAEVQEGDVQIEKEKSAEVEAAKEAAEGPVIRYVNHIVQLAVQQGASDIHVEPTERKLKIRFRIDGELYEVLNPPVGMGAAITSRIKIMAGLAIDQRRMPQDGRIRATVAQRKVDLRVSTLPCVGGEKTVMRILNDKSVSVGLDELGFDEDTLTIWKRQIDTPHGIILVTGPTGSGKTTTLYASLRQLDRNSLNISTVEDPVEYTLEGITQTQIHEKAGMTFGVALKALLRQDPDVILLGEIRDMETALTAVQAALTGHLVLSTLHTNDAPSSVTRLVNIGLEPFLVGAAVNSVLAQRLVRRLCAHCKTKGPPGEEMAEFLALHGMTDPEVWQNKGCDRCRKTGFSGRVGIYELLCVDDQVRDIIARNPNVAEFRRFCIERGMVTLRQDGMKKVAAGTTTATEVLRVTEGSH